MSCVISSLDHRRIFLCFCAFCGHSPEKLPLPIFANASFQVNKHVPHCRIVGYGKAAKLLRLEWVSDATPPTSHPYRAAKQRLRVAPGGSLGSYGFCTNPAANAAIRKHPSEKHRLSSLLQKAPIFPFNSPPERPERVVLAKQAVDCPASQLAGLGDGAVPDLIP